MQYQQTPILLQGHGLSWDEGTGQQSTIQFIPSKVIEIKIAQMKHDDTEAVQKICAELASPNLYRGVPGISNPGI